ncbi:hypothetical protein KVR01_009742 [Diaporthe batatas]|uniref:uncharacterized protein n=1 Tax=Diaporthe batatas TaxID=748121 RepID=UPI001D05AF33|nr:uncharacterized protein KVR01_009742 [Diaporthe batatas]KAG8160206.1 hypothetical protein KVR01_009742 [Diaporthe batatas]
MDGSSSRSQVAQEHHCEEEEEEQSCLLGPDGYDGSSNSAGYLVPPKPGSEKAVETKSQLLKPIDPWQSSATVHPGDLRSNRNLRPENTRNNTVTSKVQKFWEKNRSCMLVVTSSVFSSAMALFTKLLELGDDGMDAFQILFIRMGVTTIWCTSLLCFKGNPDSLLGPKEVRGLLLFRGISGFFGILGIWTAIKFLSLADASVVTFLTPTIVGFYSAIFLGQPYTPLRLTGILFALLSAFGGAGAFIAIRAIGDRCQVLTTTNSFAVCCTLISATALAIAPLVGYDQPHIRFGLPHDPRQWFLVSMITVCGFLAQWFLTAGLGSENKSHKAPAMVYMGMLWTTGFDRFFLGHSMYWTSLLGCALIVGSAVWVVAMPKPAPTTSAGAAGDLENFAGMRAPETTATESEQAQELVQLQILHHH